MDLLLFLLVYDPSQVVQVVHKRIKMQLILLLVLGNIKDISRLIESMYCTIYGVFAKNYCNLVLFGFMTRQPQFVCLAFKPPAILYELSRHIIFS